MGNEDDCISKDQSKPCKQGTCVSRGDGTAACDCADSEFTGDFCDAGRLHRCKIGYKCVQIGIKLNILVTFKDLFLFIERLNLGES